jgi:Zn-dependent M32 family carboxypeptidase
MIKKQIEKTRKAWEKVWEELKATEAWEIYKKALEEALNDPKPREA